MKNKFVLLAAIVGIGIAGWLFAGEEFYYPQADTSQPAINSDYVGLDYSTSAFNVYMTTPVDPRTGLINLTGGWTVAGVIFSSGSVSDFVQIYDATSTVNAIAMGEVGRIYNVTLSSVPSGGGANSIAFGGTVPLTKTIKLNRGLKWRVVVANAVANTGLYNSVTLLVYRNK